jgi:hypothetical protein
MRCYAEQQALPPGYTVSKKNAGPARPKVMKAGPAPQPLGNGHRMVFDIPDYLDCQINSAKGSQTKCITVSRYEGFLMDLTRHQDTDEYLTACFGKSTRSRFRKCQKRLELCFEIRYQMYFGAIDEKEYSRLFDCLQIMLERRFDQKKVFNGEMIKLDYYRRNTYQRILDQKAALFVIYDGDKPIDISINYLRDNILYSYMNGYDIDYSKFSLGMIDLIKHLEWSYGQGLFAIDLMKGDFDYKRRWCNQVYRYHSHFLYNPYSVISYAGAFFKSVIAGRIPQGVLYFKKWNLHLLYKKYKSWRYKEYRPGEPHNLPFEVLPEPNPRIAETVKAKSISIRDERYSFLRSLVYDCLYKYPEPVRAVRIYELEEMKSYVLRGAQICSRIERRL